MVRIAITVEAFEAICATLLLGSVGYEARRTEKGEVLIWLERTASTRAPAGRRLQ